MDVTLDEILQVLYWPYRSNADLERNFLFDRFVNLNEENRNVIIYFGDRETFDTAISKVTHFEATNVELTASLQCDIGRFHVSLVPMFNYAPLTDFCCMTYNPFKQKLGHLGDGTKDACLGDFRQKKCKFLSTVDYINGCGSRKRTLLRYLADGWTFYDGARQMEFIPADPLETKLTVFNKWVDKNDPKRVKKITVNLGDGPFELQTTKELTPEFKLTIKNTLGGLLK
jgi:hypothetical protein